MAAHFSADGPAEEVAQSRLQRLQYLGGSASLRCSSFVDSCHSSDSPFATSRFEKLYSERIVRRAVELPELGRGPAPRGNLHRLGSLCLDHRRLPGVYLKPADQDSPQAKA